MPRVRAAAAALAGAFLLGGCDAEVRPLRAGEDACDFCRMTVADVRFGGEVLTQGGRLRTFDSIECLAGFLRDAGTVDVRGTWVADYATSRMVPVDSARFLRGSRLAGAMGATDGLVAFAPGVPDSVLQARYGGTPVSWDTARAGTAR